MPLTLDTVTALAPDQASLKAAAQQMKPARWPVRGRAEDGPLIWGECQGSGANPYRVVVDTADLGYKCTCPSRKCPCKHTLALMWMAVEDPDAFAPAPIPEWVSEWLAKRRKKPDTAAPTPASLTRVPAAGKTGAARQLAEARAAEAAKPDPKVEARRTAAAQKRAKETEAGLLGALDDLEQWIADQLRTGLAALQPALTQRTRAIAARLVDAKAQALSGRLDEMPTRVLALPPEARPEALIAELGKLVLLARAFRAAPGDAELRRTLATSESREAVLDNPQAVRATAVWEVLGERITTRRDGLVAQSTWLLALDRPPKAEHPPFALLLDFFPASAGKRASAFTPGERFVAEMAYYPARYPLRAQIVTRSEPGEHPGTWPDAKPDPLAFYLMAENAAPWTLAAPVLLGPGRLATAAGEALWWRAHDSTHALPLSAPPPAATRGMTLERTAALWDGHRLTLLAAHSDWGRLGFAG
ncbi:MAG: SWIM zinc finger family protein [Pseudomonadota bacterium]